MEIMTPRASNFSGLDGGAFTTLDYDIVASVCL